MFESESYQYAVYLLFHWFSANLSDIKFQPCIRSLKCTEGFKKIITYELEMFSLPTVCHFEFEDKYKVDIKNNEGVGG